jgi:hypothetical protein
MKIYILVLCLIIIFLKYRLKNKKNKNKVLKFFNFSCLPFVMIILTLTFNQDLLCYFQNKESVVYSHVYTEPADF